MNSTKTSCSKKKTSTFPYFIYTLKSSWQQCAIITIVFVLAMLVPAIIFMNKTGLSAKVSVYKNELDLLAVIGFCVSVFSGFFTGMCALSYVNNKQNINLRHSFPIKREFLFLSDSLSGIIVFAVPQCVAFISTYLVIGSGVSDKSLICGKYFAMYVLSLCVFLYIYSTSLLAAGLTGTGSGKFFMILIILGLPALLYLGIIVNFRIAILNLVTSYYENTKVLTALAPIYGVLVSLLDDRGSAQLLSSALFTLPYTAVSATAALILHKYRRTEATGNTVIWKPAFVITKYLLIFTLTTVTIDVFGGNMYSGIVKHNVGDIMFGAVFGLVIGFIAVNCIMYRSPKALFRGAKGFACFAAITLVFVFVVPCNIFGFIGKNYPIKSLKSVTVSSDSGEYVLTGENKKLLEDVIEAAKNGAEVNSVIVPELYSEDPDSVLYSKFYSYYSPYSKNAIYDCGDTEVIENVIRDGAFLNVIIIQKPYFGIPLALSYSIPNDSEFFKKLHRTEEYISNHAAAEWLDVSLVKWYSVTLGDSYVRGRFGNPGSNNVGAEVNMNPNSWDGILGYVQYGDGGGTSADVASALAKVISECTRDNVANSSSPLVGIIELSYIDRSGETKSISVPVYLDSLALINACTELVETAAEGKRVTPEYSSPEDYTKKYFSQFDHAMILNTETGEAREINISDAVELADCYVEISNNGYNAAEYVQYTDCGYIIIVSDGTDCCDFLFRQDRVNKEKLAKLFENGR